MKRLISLALCAVLMMTGCASSGNTDSDSGNFGSTEKAQGGDEENADSFDNYVKPALQILGEEEEDIDRAVQNKIAVMPDRNAYMLRPVGKTKDSDMGEPAATGKTNLREYTVMIYIVGSNLESRYGSGTQDINEMEEAGLNYEKTNLLLYTGGSKRWVSDIPNNVNSVLDMAAKRENRIVAQTSEPADMGSPETLAEFINFCTRNYPAKHYALILWDHGGGPLWGYGSDELFGGDSLILKELREAMDSTEFRPGSGKKLDWVGFDACLMGALENAVLWKDYADYLVCSEEIESGRGWNYRFLSVLNETSDPQQVVRRIVDMYEEYYKENKTEFFDPDVTLSALDLSQTDNTVEAADKLFSAMEKRIKAGDYALVNQSRSRTKAFGLAASNSKEDGYDLIDLKDFSVHLGDLFPSESEAVAEAVDNMVIHSTSNVEGAGGISFYMPGSNKALYNASKELAPDHSLISSQNASFTDSYADQWLSESEISWKLGEISERAGELTLQLTPEQAANTSQAYYSVLRKISDGEYVKTLLDVPIEPDKENVLHIPKDPMLVMAVSDFGRESSAPWGCVLTESKNGENVYKTLRTFLSAGVFITEMDPEYSENVVVTFRNKEDERETTVKEVMSESGAAWNAGKKSIDVSEYSLIVDGSAFGITSERDEEGNLAPYMKWRPVGVYATNRVMIDSSFRFVMKPASEFGLDFFCQVVVRDVNDGYHGSELGVLDKREPNPIIEKKTEKGLLRYEIFDNHAELYSYEGQDSKVEVAASVDGKKVTVIQQYALYENYREGAVETVVLPDTIEEIGRYALLNIKETNLPEGLRSIGEYALESYRGEQITIPDSVEIIGNEAFRSSSLKSVKLPDSLVRIGVAPFKNSEYLEEIQISGANENYQTVDGVLYSADGKKLIQYPQAKGDSYTVIDGTEVIGNSAFSELAISNLFLKEIRFPQSLKVIESCAFEGCTRLHTPELPDALENIGFLAFGDPSLSFFPEAEPSVVRIGANVHHIKNGAFCALAAKEFEVDKANEEYASVGGFLTNKVKDTILAAPRAVGAKVVVPDGITTIPNGALKGMDYSTDFYLSDSVFRFGEEALTNTGAFNITIHCSEGSAAEAYAQKYGIDYDHEQDPNGEGSAKESQVSDSDSAVDESEREGSTAGEKVYEETALGNTWTWLVYDDHAVLASIEMEEVKENYEIPAEYKGKPVTELGYSDEDERASGYNINMYRKITVPETVTKIHRSFLDNLWSVEEIEVSEANACYSSEDGVLFRTDGTLDFYPPKNKRETYTVPEGTKEIADKACYHSEYLRKVVISEGVQRIGDMAFMNCYELKDVEFPKGLIEIGESAFSSASLHDVKLPSTVQKIDNYAFTVGEDFGTIELPESLTSMGWYAFNTSTYDGEFHYQDSLWIPAGLEFDATSIDGILVKEFEADENNPYQIAEDGVLVSKDKKILYAVPGQKEGQYTVPEGTEEIRYDAFRQCRNLTDVFLPDSVTEIGNLGVDGLYEACPYKVYCHEGTPAQKQLEENGIAWEKME